MTERKPPGVSFESWIDKQIRLAQERGDFDDLPGAGKPLPRGHDDELWWVRSYIEREGLSTEALLPTPLQLRKEIDRLPDTVRRLHTEQAVREAVQELNLRIVNWLRSPSGPQVPIGKVNADEVVEQWRASQQTADGPAVPIDHTAREARSSPLRWWRRLTGRRPAGD